MYEYFQIGGQAICISCDVCHFHI